MTRLEVDRSLFDGRNEGLACDDGAGFRAQYHPEAGPGASDAGHLFGRFVGMTERGV